MDIKKFDKGEIIEGQIYSNSGRMWLAKKDVKNSATTPKEGSIWEEVTRTPGTAYRYDVEEIGLQTFRATPRKGCGLRTFQGKDLQHVLQSASDGMTRKGPQGLGGGDIILHGIVKDLSRSWNINGWENNWPTSKIRILGEGQTLLKQWNANESVLVAQNRLAIEVKNINFEIGYDSLHAIHFKKGNEFEVSATRGKIEDVYISSFSQLAASVKLENFFNLKIDNLEVYSVNHTSLHLLNDTSLGINYGNSDIGFIRLNSPNHPERPALIFSSTTEWQHINLIKIAYLITGSTQGQNFKDGIEQGQENGIGVLYDGAATITIDKSDIEYTKYPVIVKKGSYITMNDAYINTAKDGTAIMLSDKASRIFMERVVLHGHKTSKLLSDKSSHYLAGNLIKDVSVYFELDIDNVKYSNTKLSNWVRDSDLKSIN